MARVNEGSLYHTLFVQNILLMCSLRFSFISLLYLLMRGVLKMATL